MIRQNAHKYSISALCKYLDVARSTYYYVSKGITEDHKIIEEVKKAFTNNRSVYGSRKIKAVLLNKGLHVSRRRICRIMKQHGLESAYAKSKYRIHMTECNQSSTPNKLNRQFDNQEQHAVIVSDLTYVRVNNRWNYICILIDLFNREIIGYSTGPRKDAQLVYDAFATVVVNLEAIRMFHTDRGSEFKNQMIDEMLETFGIQRSLSIKGCPYDNAVAESTFRIFKAEFVNGRDFKSIEQLRLDLADYVNWFNNIRIHGSLGYMSPIDFKAKTL